MRLNRHHKKLPVVQSGGLVADMIKAGLKLPKAKKVRK